MLGEAKRPLDIQVNGTETGLDVDVRGSGELNATHGATLARAARQAGLARLTRHGELIARRGDRRP